MMTPEEFTEKKKKELTGKIKKIPDIGRNGYHVLKIEAVTFMLQTDLPEKVFMVQRLRRIGIEGKILRKKGAKIGGIEYRIGYYIVSREGKWTWGESCPMIPQKDLPKLLKLSRSEKTIK